MWRGREEARSPARRLPEYELARYIDSGLVASRSDLLRPISPRLLRRWVGRKMVGMQFPGRKGTGPRARRIQSPAKVKRGSWPNGGQEDIKRRYTARRWRDQDVSRAPRLPGPDPRTRLIPKRLTSVTSAVRERRDMSRKNKTAPTFSAQRRHVLTFLFNSVGISVAIKATRDIDLNAFFELPLIWVVYLVL